MGTIKLEKADSFAVVRFEDLRLGELFASPQLPSILCVVTEPGKSYQNVKDGFGVKGCEVLASPEWSVIRCKGTLTWEYE